MTRSVAELRRETELARAELAATAQSLKAHIRETTAPDNIKAEVRDYISDRTTGWLDAMKRQAMENPLQALAAGAVVAVPAWRMMRAVPFPLLMVGAGLALSSSNVRRAAVNAAKPALDPVNELLGDTADQVQQLVGAARTTAADLSQRARDTMHDVGDTASAKADTLRGKVVEATSGMQDKLLDVRSKAAELQATASDRVPSAASATQFVKDNAALVGGIGIAIGALIAASLPVAGAEANILSRTGQSVRRAASEAAGAGVDTLKDTLVSAVEAAGEAVERADLGSHASRIAGNVGESLKNVAGDAITTAFDPPSHSKNLAEESHE